MTARHFVLVYNARAGALVDVLEFADATAAADTVIELERRHRADSDVHVVMLTGDSLDSVKATHGTYFRDARDAVGSLSGAAAA